MPDPTSDLSKTTQTYQPDGVLTSGGFGYINMKAADVATNVRTGQIVARFTF